MKNILFFIVIVIIFSSAKIIAQNIAVGNIDPLIKLHVAANDSTVAQPAKIFIPHFGFAGNFLNEIE